MREILFRAKRIDNGEWVEGYYLKTTLGKDIEPSDVIFVPFKINRSGQWGWIKVLPETLCQYTGMVDKNGNRIWENDILHRAYHSKDDCIVVWYDGRFCFKTIHGQYNQDPMTLLSICFAQKTVDRLAVIGSVFDDKNLLGKTDYRREQEKETED